jgi:hypothetical protein
MAQVPYASAVGSLMYAMVCTRPDIAQAVGVVSRYMANPGREHWQAVKWILRYLRGTCGVRILYGRGDGRGLTGYCDSDYAGDRDRRRSTTGYVFTLGTAAVSWRSVLQSVVALSTTEAELIAAVEAVKEAMYLRGLLRDFGVPQETSQVLSDSQSAIHLAKHQAYSSRTKHIEVRDSFLQLESKDIELQKVPTEENPADCFTKPVPATKLQVCLKLVSLVKM